MIGVGFLMADAMDKVAKKFPNMQVRDHRLDATLEKGKPKNVEGLLFKEQQAGYLAGYLAGLYAKAKGYKTISQRRRPEDPAGRPLHRRLPGGRQGGRPGDPDAERLLAGLRRPGEVQGDRAQPDPAGLEGRVPGRGRSAASARCRAAKEKGVQGIGVDADQAYLGPHVLTSAEKKVDVAVFNAIKAAQARQVRGRHQRHQRHHQRRHRLSARSTARASKYASKVDEDLQRDQVREDLQHPEHGRSRPDQPDGTTRRALALELRGITKRFGSLVANDRSTSSCARRGPRAAGRERRGQVDADERPLRALPARRGRDPGRRRAGRDRLAGDAIGLGHRHGPPALHARPGDDRGREHRARRTSRASGRLLDLEGRARRASASSPSATGWRSTPTPRSRTSASAPSSGSRSCARCSAARRSWSSTSRPRC